MPVIKLLFGEIDLDKMPDILLAMLFFACLFSATCFFFDYHTINISNHLIHFPIGLLFFPATYVISNIIQDRSGRRMANTVVACGFFSDIVLVFMGWCIAYIGDRTDYFSVFNALPIIMGATLIFLCVSSLLNTFVFESMKKIRQKSAVGLFIGFFSSITAAELLVSSMSMPLLFIKQGLTGSVILTIIITVAYKIGFNFLATSAYVYYDLKKIRKKTKALV